MLSLILVLFAGACKAIMDTVDFHWGTSIFSKIKSKKWRMWANQSEGWKNKYKNRDQKQGPAFWGSTTFFVWVTDLWHFSQMFMFWALMLAIVFFQPITNFTWETWWITAIILKIAFSASFELFFSYLLVKKKKS